jgi:hypothetical protein
MFMQIPSRILTLLWDVSVEEMTPEAGWERLVIERVMDRGCWDDMRWLLQAFDREQLREFVSGRGRRVLAPRELSFWATICGVPEGERHAWVRESRTRARAWRG